MNLLQRHGLAAILAALLLAALAFAGVQRRQMVGMEVALGNVWSNDLSGRFFGRLPQLEGALNAWAEAGEVPAQDAENWWVSTQDMLAVVNNQWQDMTGVVPDLPDKPRHLCGYLERVRDSIPRRAERTGNIPLTTEQREDLRRHARAAGAMIAAMKQAYPGWDGGFTSESGYWGRDFWRSEGWRQAMAEMDRLANAGMYPPYPPPIAGR